MSVFARRWAKDGGRIARSRQTGEASLRSMGIPGRPHDAEDWNQDNRHDKCECDKYTQKGVLLTKPLHMNWVFLSSIFMYDMPRVISFRNPVATPLVGVLPVHICIKGKKEIRDTHKGCRYWPLDFSFYYGQADKIWHSGIRSK